MPAARYWRATALEAYASADLELATLHLLSAADARLDASATLSASAAPSSGAVANLQDDDLSSAARWAAKDVPALALTWDFGAGNTADVTDVRLSGDSPERFALILKLQHSSDGSTWTDSAIFAGITWPGAGVKTASVAGAIVRNVVKGRAASLPLVNVPTGAVVPMTHGTPIVLSPVLLTVQGGQVKDLTTGVLGQGIGRVQGTVKDKGTPNAPVYRKVRLIRERDGLLLRELWSDPVTGAYAFDYVDELQTYTVLSYDHTGAFRAVVADGQIPELITP